LQAILEAALHVESDLQQPPMTAGSGLVTPSSVINNKLKDTELDGQDPVAVSKVLHVREQGSDSTSADTAMAAVDPATVFCLSPDDFNDDMDDLSFVDLPPHAELPQGLRSVPVASDCQHTADVAAKNSSALSVVSDVTSKNHCLQSTNSTVLDRSAVNGVSNTVSAQIGNHGFAACIDFQRENGKCFPQVVTIAFMYCLWCQYLRLIIGHFPGRDIGYRTADHYYDLELLFGVQKHTVGIYRSV